MQTYNPYNPVSQYRSIKTEAPKIDHVEEDNTPEDEISNQKIPNSYGLYLQPPQFKDPTMKSTTFLHYIGFTIDSADRDYTKYPNPFQFVCENFSEYFKNIKIFQLIYITLPQFNLVKVVLSKDDNYDFMFTYVTANADTIVNNQLIDNGTVTYRICNFYNNEVNFLINDNISIVYSINIKNTNYFNYGISSSYKLSLQPFIRLNIPEIEYLPVMSTDKQQFTYLLRTSRAKNYISYTSTKSPTKVFKEQNLLNFRKLTFNFYDSFNNPMKILYLDRYADPTTDTDNFASKYNYIRHPLFYYHQIVMFMRVGVIYTTLK